MGVGITINRWFYLLIRHRFAVDISRLPSVLLVTFISILNTIIGCFENAVFNKRVGETKLIAPPLFIIGYWRTGTTHLHNLLSLDEKFTYPTTYTCLFPNHFLLTEHTLKKRLKGFLPQTRPMDNMQLSWDTPQEDEIALALITGLSPYIDFAFPQTPLMNHRFLDFKEATSKEIHIFKETLSHFVRKHTYRSNKRVVLKSPTHTFRIRLLARIFPGAKFIHIVRDPVTVYLSAIHTFKIQRRLIGLKKPDDSMLELGVMKDILLCYRSTREIKEHLKPDDFCEIRFEDLENQPITEIEKIYSSLKLRGFESVRSNLESYLASITGYKKNVYDIPDWKRNQLHRIFSPILAEYGYQNN